MLAFVVLSCLYYLLPDLIVGRGVLALALLLFGLFQFAIHCGFQVVLKLPGLAQRVLVFGVGPLAQTIEDTMGTAKNNYVFSGFVQPKADIMTVSSDRIVGSIDNIAEVIKQHKAQKLVVSITERRGVLPVRELLKCKLNGVDVVESVSFYEQLTGKLLIENIQPSWFIYSNGFRVTPFMRLYKRAFDILFSSFGLLLASPLLPVVALLIKLDSPARPGVFQAEAGGGEGPGVFCLQVQVHAAGCRNKNRRCLGGAGRPQGDPAGQISSQDPHR